MNFNVCKQIRCFIPILKNYYQHVHCLQRNCSNKTKIKCTILRSNRPLLNSFLSATQFRDVSSSNLKKSDNSNSNENFPKDEQDKNILDDIEFRNILSDFSKDFGVGSDSEHILEEIRKSIDNDLIDGDLTPDRQKKDFKHSAVEKKFKEFSETDSVVIPSFEEEQNVKRNEEFFYHIHQPTNYQFTPDQIKRGIFGVYDIEDLVAVLRNEKLVDIAVISVPKHLHYTDYLIIATANSPRHSKAVCEHVVKLYKLKKNPKDPFVIVEGEKTSEWKALDMENIVLHIFLEETRALYDIESLWLFDSAFDRGGNVKQDPLYEAIEEQMAFFNSINESITENSSRKAT